jgi:hemerythrin-like metal-binding protein
MHKLDQKQKADIALIDQQHEQLMELMQFVKTDKKVNENPARFLEALVEINDLAREHFDHEERLLEQLGYDRLESHISQHERILYDLNDLILSCMNNELSDTASTELIQIMTDWFEKHVIHEDTVFFTELLSADSQSDND